MKEFLFRQVLSGAIVIILGISALVVMIHAVPGDPANVLLGPRATPEMKEALRVEMGLDKPLLAQIVIFISNAVRGDLGFDVFSQRPVSQIILDQLPYTITLVVSAIAAAAIIGIPLGCYSALYRDSLGDKIIGVLSVGAIAIPSFVIAIYAVLVFSVQLRWLPSIGAGTSGDLVSQARHLILPAFAIAVNWVGYLARFVRASMLEVLGETHIRAARAHGLRESRIIYRYALPLAVLPTITIIGTAVGHLISAAVLIEIVFARPGIGKLLFDSVVQRNYPVVIGTVLVTIFLFVLCTAIAELINWALDPRARR